LLLSQKDESGGNEEKIGKNQEKNREKTGRKTKKSLTNTGTYVIVNERMEEGGSFFYAQNISGKRKRSEENDILMWRWKLCVQELHWHVQNVNSEITT